MTTHVSEIQVRRWLDDGVVREVTGHGSEDTALHLQLELSRLPIHLVKEDRWGPIRVVGRTGFDTDRSRALLRDDANRAELLRSLAAMLAATPGFYTFLDGEGTSCDLRRAETLQVEYRLYPDESDQQALMDAIMAIGTCMRSVRNVVGEMLAEPEPGSNGATAG